MRVTWSLLILVLQDHSRVITMDTLLTVLSLCGIGIVSSHKFAVYSCCASFSSSSWIVAADLRNCYLEAQSMVQPLTCGQWAVFLQSFSMGSQYCLERMRYIFQALICWLRLPLKFVDTRQTFSPYAFPYILGKWTAGYYAAVFMHLINMC